MANGPSGGGFDTALLGAVPPGSAFKIVTTTALLKTGLNFNAPVVCSPQEVRLRHQQLALENAVLEQPDDAQLDRVDLSVRHFDGPAQAKGRTRRKAETPFTEMWANVDQGISSVVDKTTFADLLRRWQEKQNRYVMNWEI